MVNRKGPDTWKAPSKEERLQAKAAMLAAQRDSEMTIAQRLELATMNQSLPCEVEYEIDALLRENPGTCVRIIYGIGSGKISGAVLQYLHRLSKSKARKIGGFREDPRCASCVVYVN